MGHNNVAGKTVSLTITKADHFITDDTWMARLIKEQSLVLDKKRSDLIKNRLKEVIIDIEEKDADWINEHLSVIIKEGENYSHYYYDFGKDTEVRIISIQRNASVSFEGNKVEANLKFY